MKKQNVIPTSYKDQVNTDVKIGYLTEVQDDDRDIKGVLAYLSQHMRLDPRVSQIDYVGAQKPDYDMATMMSIYMKYIKKLNNVVNPVEALSIINERNDVIYSVDKVMVVDEPNDPKAYKPGEFVVKSAVVKTEGVRDSDVLAMICAEIIAYTTDQDASGNLRQTFDVKKSKSAWCSFSVFSFFT